MSASIEQRLNQIEAALGIEYNDTDGTKNDGADNSSLGIHSRINSLLESAKVTFSSSSISSATSSSQPISISFLNSNLKECDKIAREFSPSGLVLATDSTNTPASINIYRKQEILARYEDLQKLFEILAKIRDLLSISNPSLPKELQAKTSKGANSKMVSADGVSVDSIGSAPILSSSAFAFAADPVNDERLNAFMKEILDMRARSSSLAGRVDSIVDRYYSVMSAVNEKMVLLQEQKRG